MLTTGGWTRAEVAIVGNTVSCRQTHHFVLGQRDGRIWPLRIELVRFRLFDFNLSVLPGASLGLYIELVLLKRMFL